MLPNLRPLCFGIVRGARVALQQSPILRDDKEHCREGGREFKAQKNIKGASRRVFWLIGFAENRSSRTEARCTSKQSSTACKSTRVLSTATSACSKRTGKRSWRSRSERTGATERSARVAGVRPRATTRWRGGVFSSSPSGASWFSSSTPCVEWIVPNAGSRWNGCPGPRARVRSRPPTLGFWPAGPNAWPGARWPMLSAPAGTRWPAPWSRRWPGAAPTWTSPGSRLSASMRLPGPRATPTPPWSTRSTRGASVCSGWARSGPSRRFSSSSAGWARSVVP